VAVRLFEASVGGQTVLVKEFFPQVAHIAEGELE
jgi:hypothetical protein